MGRSLAARAVSPLFERVETVFFGLILFFCWGCSKRGGRGGVFQPFWLGPGPGLGLLWDGCEGDGGVFEGGVESCFRSPGGGMSDGFDHKWYLRLRSFSHRIFDCAPEGANYMQTGHAGVCPIGFRTIGRFSGSKPLLGRVRAIPGLRIEIPFGRLSRKSSSDDFQQFQCAAGSSTLRAGFRQAQDRLWGARPLDTKVSPLAWDSLALAAVVGEDSLAGRIRPSWEFRASGNPSGLSWCGAHFFGGGGVD